MSSSAPKILSGWTSAGHGLSLAEVLLQHAELIDPQEYDAKQALIEQLLAQAYKGKNGLH